MYVCLFVYCPGDQLRANRQALFMQTGLVKIVLKIAIQVLVKDLEHAKLLEAKRSHPRPSYMVMSRIQSIHSNCSHASELDQAVLCQTP